MTSERGQATIEWLGLVVLLALGLGAAARLVPGAGDRRDPGLGPLLARSIACAPAGCAQEAGRRAAPAPAVRPASASGPATAGALRRRRALRPRALRPRPLRPRALPRAGAELERAVAAFRPRQTIQARRATTRSPRRR